MTRSQPQYGYAIRQIPQGDLSNLAEHHYLVTFMALKLAQALNKKGAKLNIEKVLEISLLHDLGELFGGDISMPYAIANPAARKHAKAFEAENLKFINKFYMDNDEKELEHLLQEIQDAKTDEGLISKVADRLECAHYLFYMRQVPKNFIAMNTKSLNSVVSKISDPIAKKELKKFIPAWTDELQKGDILDQINYA